MADGARKDRGMHASHPVVRSGLILTSNLNLTVDDAKDGVKYLDNYCDEFQTQMRVALEGIGATDIVDRGPEAKTTEPNEAEGVGRGMRFRGVAFQWEGYEIDARAGVTICEGDRRSKVAVRVMCVSRKSKPAEEMSASEVAAFFEHAEEDIAKALLRATRAVYELALKDFSESSKRQLTANGEALLLKDRVAYVMRAYDSSDERIDDMILEMSRGRRLPRVLKRDGYRLLFQELWNMAHSSLDQPLDVEAAIDELRADNGTDFVFIEAPFRREGDEVPDDHDGVDLSSSDEDEQKAIILSQFEKRADGVPVLKLTGIMSVSELEDSASTEKRLYASRLVSGAVVANFASQF